MARGVVLVGIDRNQAYALLAEYTKSPGLINHGLAVEAGMRHYARLWGEDEDLWGVTGLLHDFDYEKWPSPEDHPFRGAEILREQGYPEEVVRAILGHADYSGVPRNTLMAKTLYAVDELTGFIVAVALVRPSKSVHDVKLSSVKKKLKEKSFARGVDREQLRRGAEELGVPFDDHIANVIEALQGIAASLGLD